MRRSACKVLVLAVCGLFIASFVGCNEESLSDTRKSRLISAENIQLRKELKSQKEQLDKCLQEKKASVEGRQGISEFLIGENNKLRGENEKLKGQIEQLRKEVKKL
jgi:peptidoglycan hydrolase CwlO-like protein